MNSVVEASIHLSLNEPKKVLYVSDNIEALLGFKAADFSSGKVTVQSRIHDHDQDIANHLFSTDMTEPYGSFNIRLRQANGRIICAKGIFTKTESSDGIVLELLLQDAKSLRQDLGDIAGMANFTAIMENTDDYIYFKDKNHVFTGASQTLVDLTSPSVHWTDLLGQTDYDVFPEEYADIYYHLEKLVFSGVHVAQEVQETLDNEGNKGWVDNRKYPIKDESGEIIGLFGIARDITTYKLQQQQVDTLLKEQATIINNPLVGFGVLRDRHISWLNPTLETMLGYDKNELNGCSTRQLYASDEEYQFVGNAYKDFEDEGIILNEVRFVRKDGEFIWLDMRGAIVHDVSGSYLSVMVIDATDKIRVKTNLQKSEQALRVLAEYGSTNNDNIFNLIVQQLAISQGFRYALIAKVDSDNSSLVNTIAVWSTDKIIDNFTYDLKGTPCKNVLKSDACFYPNDIQHLFPEDHLLVDMQAESYVGVPLKNDKGHIFGIIALLDDRPKQGNEQTISLLKSLSTRASIELERMDSDQKLHLSSRVFTDTHEGIIITDNDRLIVDVNPAFCDITGYSLEEVIGQNPKILSSGKQSPEFYEKMWQHLSEYGYWQGEIWNRKKDGEIYAELLNISTLLDDTGNVINYVGIFSDISQNKKQQEKLNLMAHYDVLTGLPNRTLFADRFHQAIAHSKRIGTQLAICFLDLDYFKPLNDAYGHQVGDQLLISVAERIKASIRDEDTISRQGGDEFALLLGEIESIPQCEHFLVRLLASIAEPYIIEGVTHNISASIGVTLYPFDDADLDTLLRHADQAMYLAKQTGRNRHHLFSVEQDQQDIYKYHRLEEIQHALANNEFQLYYQPKVNMATGNVFGAEALIRWNHPEKGLVPPLEFLPIIEGTNLEIQVGEWVIEQALLQLEQWKEQGLELEVSINISSHHLLSGFFDYKLGLSLERHPAIDPQYLQLEILETSALGDLHLMSDVIETCQETLGVNVALDDFGTGFSSLTHIRNLPVNVIKIDQSFVRDMLDDPNDYAIIDGVLGLADAFDRDVIAEGVETTQHGLMLLIMGCEEAQGYSIAKPMPAKDFSEWHKHYTPNQEWITCANKASTDKDNKVKLFRLVTEQWLAKFKAVIVAPADTDEQTPIMNARQCQCGTWIKRSINEHLFEDKWIHKLGRKHDKVHLIANDLLNKYHNSDIESAREGLAKLQTAFDEMNNTLEMLELK